MPESKRAIQIGAIVAFLLAAGGITYWNLRGPEDSVPIVKGAIQIRCTNPDCGKDYEITQDELKEMVRSIRAEMPADTPRAMFREIVFGCKFCGEQSAYVARRCPKCDHIFLPDFSRKDYADRCPECGTSRLEEMGDNW